MMIDDGQALELRQNEARKLRARLAELATLPEARRAARQKDHLQKMLMGKLFVAHLTFACTLSCTLPPTQSDLAECAKDLLSGLNAAFGVAKLDLEAVDVTWRNHHVDAAGRQCYDAIIKVK